MTGPFESEAGRDLFSVIKARGSPYESPPQRRGPGSPILPKAKGMDDNSDPKRLQDSILRPLTFPTPPDQSGGAQIRLAFREKACGRLSGHGFSTGASLLICGSKAAGVPRGMALLVAGRSPRRGGRERSDRWKGESAAFSLQRDAVGNERADESIPEPAPSYSLTI
jgi:hypothetical protein